MWLSAKYRHILLTNATTGKKMEKITKPYVKIGAGFDITETPWTCDCLDHPQHEEASLYLNRTLFTRNAAAAAGDFVKHSKGWLFLYM